MNPENPALEELLATFNDALNGSGERLCWGIHDPELLSEYIAQAKAHSTKPYCVVADWQMWYVKCGDDMSDLTDMPPRVEMVLYAKKILDDEKRRFSAGSQLRSTPIVRKVFTGVYESLNTTYILVGDGIKKDVSADVVNRLFF